LGGTLGAEAVAAMHRCAMPVPKVERPMTRVVIDRTTSQVALGNGPYASAYAQLERWIPRLGYYTIRLTGEDVFSGDAVIVIRPERTASKSFREGLKRYVENGGKLLVFDSADNANSTANDLLQPFGLSMSHEKAWDGMLTISGDWPDMMAPNAREVEGGSPMSWIGGHPVAAEAVCGKGRVMAIGFATFFNDENMGMDCLAQPSAEQLQRYETLYSLVRRLVEGKEIVPPATAGEPNIKQPPRGRLPSLPAPSQRKPGFDLPGKEFGPQEESPK
jgi:hypothetical protein